MDPIDPSIEYEMNREQGAAEQRAINARSKPRRHDYQVGDRVVAGHILPTHDGKPVQANADLYTDIPGVPKGKHRRWNATGDEFVITGRVYEGEYAGQFRTQGIHSGELAIHSMAVITALSTAVHADDAPCPRNSEPPAPHDDEQQHGDPMAATLSDRTIAKVLSRPAHVNSIAMLDRDAAAQHLASAAADVLAMPAKSPIHRAMAELRQALADYRETTR